MAVELWSGQTSLSTSVSGASPVSTATANIVAGPIAGYGGTTTTNGAYTIHTFTSSGTFYVNSAVANGVIEYLCVGGGGGGGSTYQGAMNGGWFGGGGGAGGYLTYFTSNVGFGNNFQGPPVYVNQGDSFTITVGAGGASVTNGGNSSITSSLYSITSFGGGAGGISGSGNSGGNGGSGGGGGTYVVNIDWSYGSKGYSIAQMPRQGFDGKSAAAGASGIGGGANQTNSITGNTYSVPGPAATGSPGIGANASPNTGNGGGGSSSPASSLGYGPYIGGSGGSGIVIIRYRTT